MPQRTAKHLSPPKSLVGALWLALLLPSFVGAAVLSGTVRDESGAILIQTSVQISGGALPQPLKLLTDATGKYTTPDLKPGSYTLTVTREGFQPLTKAVAIELKDVTVDVNLSLEAVETEVTVSGKAPKVTAASTGSLTNGSTAPKCRSIISNIRSTPVKGERRSCT
jgi:hypothetical protein